MVKEPQPKNQGDPPIFQTDSQIVLDLPTIVSNTPDATHAPFPGVYRLCVGFRSSLGLVSSTAAIRCLSAWRHGSGLPVDYPASPILNPANGFYILNGRGFIPGNTEVLLETVALMPSPGANPVQGEFLVSDPQTIVFVPPKPVPTVVMGCASGSIRWNPIHPCGLIYEPTSMPEYRGLPSTILSAIEEG